MAISCEMCHGLAVPAAQTKTFKFKGQTLHCLEFISSCMICGHRWEDIAYVLENSHHVEQACAVLAYPGNASTSQDFRCTRNSHH